MNLQQKRLVMADKNDIIIPSIVAIVIVCIVHCMYSPNNSSKQK